MEMIMKDKTLEVKQMTMTITYSDLSIPLKIAYISSWIVGVVMFLSFLIGFVLGVLGV
jgi:hypothetical protein